MAFDSSKKRLLESFFEQRRKSEMAAITSDILNIGSSKWQEQRDDMQAQYGGIPTTFMLPSVENVSRPSKIG